MPNHALQRTEAGGGVCSEYRVLLRQLLSLSLSPLGDLINPTMQELPANLVRVIEAATDSKIKAITYDLEIDADNLKYSSWISALATGGLALIITNFEKLLSPYLVKLFPAPLGPIAAAISLAAAIGVGAYLNWVVNQEFARKRLTMTYFMKQKCLLLTNETDIDPEERGLSGRLLRGEYLPKDVREIIAKLGSDQLSVDCLMARL